jgi:23S rRNA-/tRNA-specific pseudouridylate synthase
MAKLTVFFKYKAIDSFLFEKGVVHIGRDDTNDLKIDSLAVAPVHAAVVVLDDATTIKQLNDSFPLIVNGQKVKEYSLNNNDMITIGKHDLVYSITESVIENQPHESVYFGGEHSFNLDESQLHAASLQVLNGQNIGKVLSLKKPMTRLGNSGSGVIIISKRKDGYFASALENSDKIMINNVPIENNYRKLNNNDVVVINDISLQFFLS